MSYDERFIYIMAGFDDTLASIVTRRLFELDNKGKRDILLVINSEGGDVSTLFAIHDAMKLVRSDVATLCMGRAYSAAACLLISGAKGKRFITPMSDIMFHEVSAEVGGKISSMKDEMVSIQHYDNMMQRIAHENLGIPYKKVLRRRHEAYYDAKEALKVGAVDHIVSGIEEIGKFIDLK